MPEHAWTRETVHKLRVGVAETRMRAERENGWNPLIAQDSLDEARLLEAEADRIEATLGVAVAGMAVGGPVRVAQGTVGRLLDAPPKSRAEK